MSRPASSSKSSRTLGPGDDPGLPDGLVRVDAADLLRRAVGCVLALLILGALGGVVWGVLSPGVTGLVVATGKAGELRADSAHRFDAVAVFACVAAVIGVLGAVGVWSVRGVRGPIGVGVTVVGSAIGSAAGVWLGGLVAAVRHPGPGGTAIGRYYTSAPGVRLPGATIDVSGLFGAHLSVSLSWSVVVVAPVTSLLTLVVLVLANRADLGVPVTGMSETGVSETGAPEPVASTDEDRRVTEADAGSRTRPSPADPDR